MLLARVLLGFAIQFEQHSRLSLALCANVLRVLDDTGVRVRDLPLLSGVSKESISMAMGVLEKAGHAAVVPDPDGGRQLVARGLDVVAVEPSDGMRAELGRVLPGTPALAGWAERIPLADRAVDAVLFAQAWHWVDPARAVPEVVRVLSPGGTLGLVWNERDERNERDEQVGWVAELGRIIGEERGQDNGPGENTSDHPQVGPPFSPLERHEVTWIHRLSVAELLDMVASRSYIILLSPPERQALLDRVRQLTETDPALAGQPDIALPYETLCWRCHLA